MRYRVHYLADNQRRTAEVEATSPQEAIVKFQHASGVPEQRPGQQLQVLGVSPEPEVNELAW